MPLLPVHDIRRIGAPHILGAGGALGSGLPGGGAGGPVAAAAVAGSDTMGYRPAPLSEAPPSTLTNAASERWVRRIVDTVNNSLRGKLNVALSVTLAAGATSTIIKDVRISGFSVLLPMPRTANAAAELAAGGFYVSAQKSGEATIEHANSAQTDRLFRVAIFG